SSEAEYILIGIVTKPKLIEPFQIDLIANYLLYLYRPTYYMISFCYLNLYHKLKVMVNAEHYTSSSFRTDFFHCSIFAVSTALSFSILILLRCNRFPRDRSVSCSRTAIKYLSLPRLFSLLLRIIS